ncbi:Protein of unknown function [Friedmanniella luteola]|uniref:DUF2510 domain-containing protein n=1 Tax=Friedmanniella luteola TaxID=546871 RepID=A0A1H1L470_9ACTN|nr:DUF2510 domain-containing protein [Friedmanniella luteola]SDR68805.1 Protein of unknown function [Friedmanniella luteola]
MSAPDPGWYADPSGSADVFRWWDGAAWSRWLSRDATVGPPEQAPTLAPPVDPADAAGPPPTPPAGVPADPSASAGPPAAAPGPAGVRLPVAVALVAAVVVVAVVAVGAVVSASAQRLPSGPAVAPPTGETGGPAVVYDAATRTASIEELRLVLPVEPYACSASPSPPCRRSPR